ncbi:hypothetical protein EKL30_07340 [Candidimonas sp. SYP-B2681]|uniref:hypothetical protein n=1 Tax=Candidimonas sp. SYP-B2681 TaxID=2497686 RepID=UPI000F879805|nr:hypothetical protein [Candidimonas sp. SYP-B2681]RTZ44387.1 hypothetical protein EKL30_07340 [Candidimonas sp. SYP-B2681]
MKRIVMFAAVVVLAGCATKQAGVREYDLRDPQYFHTERTLPLTFPKIQMALFKHKTACGSAPKFSMDPRQTNYATIIDLPEDAVSLERAVLADLIQLQGTMMEESRVRVKVYSYYSDAAADKRVEQFFNAILRPEVCADAK